EFQTTRDFTIGPTIKALTEYTRNTLLYNTRHIYVLLLGGMLRDLQANSSLSYEGKTPFMETNYGPKCLSDWINGYGHIPHVYPKGFAQHGYVPTAAFLQHLVPAFKSLLFAKAPKDPSSPNYMLEEIGNNKM
ncbi:hypothetical protein VP01_12376g1, partial [Puccinia sorghi]